MRDSYKLYSSKIAYLDPATCGSLIGYKLVKEGRYFSGSMTLSDCNRMIDWSFGDDPEDIEKVDKAISILTEFRVNLLKAQKSFKRDVELEEAKEKEKKANA